MSTARYQLRHVVASTASSLGLGLRLQIAFLRSRTNDNFLTVELERLEQEVTGMVGRIVDVISSGGLDDEGYKALYQSELTTLNSVCQEISSALEQMLIQISPDDLSSIQKNIDVTRSELSIVAHAYANMLNPKDEGD